MTPLRILLYEDNPRLRESLELYLSYVPGLLLCGQYENCLHAAEQVRMHKPDVVVMDIDMPGLNGIEGVKHCKESRPDTLILMYTVFEDAERLFASLRAGANGYILKKADPADLVQAIREVSAGGAPMSPVMAKKVLHFFHEQTPATPDTFKLTTTEREVLTLLTKGLSYKEIAAQRGVAFETVRTHLQNIYTKLHVNSGTEAVSKALRLRLVEIL